MSDKKTYVLFFTQTMSTSVEVEAEDFDEAVELAYNSPDLAPAQLDAQSSGWGRPWTIDTSGDWEVDENFYIEDGRTVMRIKE